MSPGATDEADDAASFRPLGLNEASGIKRGRRRALRALARRCVRFTSHRSRLCLRLVGGLQEPANPASFPSSARERPSKGKQAASRPGLQAGTGRSQWQHNPEER